MASRYVSNKSRRYAPATNFGFSLGHQYQEALQGIQIQRKFAGKLIHAVIVETQYTSAVAQNTSHDTQQYLTTSYATQPLHLDLPSQSLGVSSIEGLTLEIRNQAKSTREECGPERYTAAPARPGSGWGPGFPLGFSTPGPRPEPGWTGVVVHLCGPEVVTVIVG